MPPSAPVASTTLYSIGDMSLGAVFASMGPCAVATLVTILRIGATIRWREALRSA